MMSYFTNTERSKLDKVGTFIMQEDVVSPCVYVPMCNQSCLECNLILSQGVTAGPTLGLIPSIHLQRHCQSMQHSSKREREGERERGRERGDRGGRKKEKREGRHRRRRKRRELSRKSIQ